MRHLNSRSFFLQWNLLCAETNPGQRKDRWQVDGVDWAKERHSYWGEHYSMHLDVHRLTYRRGSKTDWELLVVTEQWWGPDRQKGIRNTNWCKAICGKPEQILAWLKKQDAGKARLQ